MQTMSPSRVAIESIRLNRVDAAASSCRAWRRLFLAFTVGVLAASCSFRSTSGRPVAGAAPRPAAAVSSFTRDCSTAVRGVDVAGRPGGVKVGPVIFAGMGSAADLDAADFDPAADGRFPALKFVTQVEARGKSSLLLQVVSEGNAQVALLYEIGRYNSEGLYAIEDGTSSVRFVPCEDRPSTQFNGGLIVSGPTCVELTVMDERGEVLGRRRLPFGPARC